MHKLWVFMLILVLFLSGCSVARVDNSSIKGIIETILYKDNNLSNKSLNGYSFYLPKGVKIVDRNESNLKLKDDNLYYYIYIDTIAYHYKTLGTYTVNEKHIYTDILLNNNYYGFIDIEKDDDKYFVVLMYNYAKIEAYVFEDDFNRVLMNMCSILSSIKYNDEIINSYIDENNSIFQEETFDIFSSKRENNNLLTYDDYVVKEEERKTEEELDIETID